MKNTLKFGAATAVAALALTACGAAPEAESGTQSGSDQSGAAAGSIKACMVSDSGGFDDKSFNQSGHEGMERAKSELGIEVDYAESQQDGDFTPNIQNMVQGGCDVIFGVGYLMADAMNAAAKANPTSSSPWSTPPSRTPRRTPRPWSSTRPRPPTWPATPLQA